MPKAKKELNFIDVFSGAGGLSCGLELAGLNCLLGVDINKHAMTTFLKNHKKAKVFCGNIQDLKPPLLKELTDGKKIHAVVGGPPCQGFSTVGTGDPKDKRNSLFKHFVRIVKETRPFFIVVENVTGLLATKNEKTLRSIFKEFSQLGYNLDVQVMSSEQYGVPEKRRRTIILGSLLNDSPTFPSPSHNIYKGKKFIAPVTVGEAFANLECKNGKILNHDVENAQVSNKLDLKRLKRVPEGSGIRYQKDEEKYLPPSLRFDIDWETIREKRFRQTKFQRLDRNKPSPTIMTHRHGYFHPVQPRYLTQREAAKCQSFPNNFEFCGPLSAQWRQIGNAVPPLLGKAIGKSLLNMFKEAKENTFKSVKPNKKKILELIYKRRKEAFIYKEPKTI